MSAIQSKLDLLEETFRLSFVRLLQLYLTSGGDQVFNHLCGRYHFEAVMVQMGVKLVYTEYTLYNMSSVCFKK